MSNSIVEIEDTKCVFIFGYNASTSHPIVARRLTTPKQKGAKIIVCDPRKIETARIADIYAPLANGSNVAFFECDDDECDFRKKDYKIKNLLMNTPKTSMRSMKP